MPPPPKKKVKKNAASLGSTDAPIDESVCTVQARPWYQWSGVRREPGTPSPSGSNQRRAGYSKPHQTTLFFIDDLKVLEVL